MRGLGFLFALAFSSVSIGSPFLQGTVRDETGLPIEGATVRIWDCIGTCFGGDTRITDSSGHYVFEKPTFNNFPSLTVSMPGRYHVSTDYSGPALHAEDTDVPRLAEFVLGTPAAVSVRLDGDAPDGWTQSLKLRASRNVKLHRYDLTGEHSSRWSTWSFDLVPRNEPCHLVIVRKPTVEPTDDKKEMRQVTETSIELQEILEPFDTFKARKIAENPRRPSTTSTQRSEKEPESVPQGMIRITQEVQE